MAANASDDDKGDKTRFGVAPPPQVKRPPPPDDQPAPKAPPGGEAPRVVPTPAPDTASASPDRTQPGGALPPLPKLTPPGGAPPAPSGERTGGGISPPPRIPRPELPAATLRPELPRPEPVDDADEEGTVFEPLKRKVTATLQRLQPPGHSEVVYLDRTSYVLGRSHKSDVQLYSPSASREHARLTFRDAAWYVQPLEGKTVLADGVKVRDEQCLEHKMRLRLGGDELLFIDESAATASVAPAPAATGSAGRWFGILVGVVVVGALAVVAWWVLAVE